MNLFTSTNIFQDENMEAYIIALLSFLFLFIAIIVHVTIHDLLWIGISLTGSLLCSTVTWHNAKPETKTN
jgi:hypothetical protein